METKRKLYKSGTDKFLAGVIGGLGEYFHIDSTILRLGYVLIAIITGIVPAIIAYIIAVVIVPDKPLIHHMDYTEPKKETPQEEKKEEPAPTETKSE